MEFDQKGYVGSAIASYIGTGIFALITVGVLSYGHVVVGFILILVCAFFFTSAQKSKKIAVEGLTAIYPEEVVNFEVTSKFKEYIAFNDNTKQILIYDSENPRIVNYSDILDFEIYENSKIESTKYGENDYVSHTESRKKVTDLGVRLTLNDMDNPIIEITTYASFSGTEYYEEEREDAEKIMAMLKIATGKRKRR